MRLPFETGSKASPYGQSDVPAGVERQPDVRRFARSYTESRAILTVRGCRYPRFILRTMCGE
jgi:hypothetical protein